MDDMRQLSDEIKRILRSPYRVALNVSSPLSLPLSHPVLLLPGCLPAAKTGSQFHFLLSPHTRENRKGNEKPNPNTRKPVLLHSRVTPLIRKPFTFSVMPIRMLCKSGLAVIHARLMVLQRPFLMAPNSSLSHWTLSDFCVR